MDIAIASTTTPGLGKLVEHPRGIPHHGEFVLARSTDASLVLSTMSGTRMWRSPDDRLERVLVEAQAAAREAGQAVAIIGADPGHWQQLFVVPLFSIGAGGAHDAVTAISHLRDVDLERGRHLFGLADATTAIDMTGTPVAQDLLPPRARPTARG